MVGWRAAQGLSRNGQRVNAVKRVRGGGENKNRCWRYSERRTGTKERAGENKNGGKTSDGRAQRERERKRKAGGRRGLEPLGRRAPRKKTFGVWVGGWGEECGEGAGGAGRERQGKREGGGERNVRSLAVEW